MNVQSLIFFFDNLNFFLCVLQSSLQFTPWGLSASLEEQVAELKVDCEVKSSDSTNLDASQVISGKMKGSQMSII